MSQVLGPARLPLGEGGSTSAWLEIDGATIVAVHREQPRHVDADLAGCVALPGFIDLHCHGGGGASFTSADGAQISTAVATHRRHGTTTMNASLVAATYVDLARQIQALIPFVDDGVLHGIHLEGPWISHQYCGAHDPDLLRAPDPDDVAKILEIGAGRISMVTIAPELPGAMDSIECIVAAGAVAAIGHTAATAEITREAIERGATVATHLFNAMPPLLHRHPGPVGVLLGDDRVIVELICDLVHLDADVVSLAMSSARGRVALITDAMAAAGGPDGAYLLGGLEVDVVDGVARVAGTSSLAGSTLLLDHAVRNAVSAGRTLAAVSEAASAVPAQALGLRDRGRLEAGQRADLVLLDAQLRVQRVMRAGAWVT